MIILGFSATVYLYVGSGPYWTDADVDKRCQENWWRNLLYINNFIDTTDQVCFHGFQQKKLTFSAFSPEICNNSNFCFHPAKLVKRAFP